MELSRSTYYYGRSHRDRPRGRSGGGRPIPGYSQTKAGRIVSDDEVKEWICELIEGEGYAYGYLKLTVCLRKRYGLVINKKKVYRLCKELGLLRPQRRVRPKHPKRLARNRVVTGPNQLWETDVKYGYIEGERRFFFVMSVLDVYDRSVVASHIGLSATGKDAALTLGNALWERKLLHSDHRPVIRTDNGPQFIADVFEEACSRYGVEHERIPARTPNKNAHIEAFHRLLEEECLSLHEFETYAEGYEQVAKYMEFYNTTRMHSSLKFMTPEECYRATQCGNMKLPSVRA